MLVKHKLTGKTHEVSDDYFSKYEDKLQVLEVVKAKPKATKKTKVVSDDAPQVQE
jgi:hypothetical protein